MSGHFHTGDRANELYKMLHELIEEGDFCDCDVMSALVPLMGHTIGAMSKGSKEMDPEQPKALEFNLKMAKERLESHARMQCDCEWKEEEIDDKK